MFEARIKRTLWAVSVLVALGFGAHSAYKFFDAYQIDAAAQQWHKLNGQWYFDTCYQSDLDFGAKSVCYDSEKMRTYYDYGPSRARGEGLTSLAVAVAVPIGLWVLFFLARWIWTGSIRHVKSPETERLPLLKRKLLYRSLGAIACAALFSLNVVMLPSGRAVQVLISSVVQVVGLVLVVWIVKTLYNAVRGQSPKKQTANQQTPPKDPPQASSH